MAQTAAHADALNGRQLRAERLPGKIKHSHLLLILLMDILVLELALCMHIMRAPDDHLISKNDSSRHLHGNHQHLNHLEPQLGKPAHRDKLLAEGDELAPPEETANKLSTSLIMLAQDDKEVEDEGHFSNNGPRLNNMRRLLVRQLTNLIMNHEPESIAEHMEGTKISGQMVSESALEENEAGRMEPAVGSNLEGEKGYAFAPDIGQDRDSEKQQANSEIQAYQEPKQENGSSSSTAPPEPVELVTCPPDYEDQAPYEAVGNLTAEQQQQLFADSSGLLPASSNLSETDKQATTTTSTALARPNSNPIQCVHPGSRMIEFITKVITPILFGIIIVVGLLGNIIVMLVILEDRKTDRELTPTNLLILDLSLADLSFIIFCIPFTGWDYAVGHWVFGQFWCKCNQYLIVVCALSSIYTLVLMSVDRFLAIVYPIECMSYRTSRNTLYAIYIKWIIILLIASPTISMHGLVELPLGESDQYNCRFLVDQYNPLHFQIAFFITSYLFPLILIFCLYLSLLNKLWFGTKPHGHRESHKMLESKKKVTWLVAGIVVVFALCWCPIQIMLILMRLKSHRITATYVAIQVFSHILGYMNSCVNPIVYAFASETFHNSFKRSSFGRFFYGLCCCSNRHDRDRSHSNTNRMDTAHINNTTVTIALNHNRGGGAMNPQQQSANHVQLNNDNNLSTTTLVITPHNSNNSGSNSENSNRIVVDLEPRARGSSNKPLGDIKTQVREARGATASTIQQIGPNDEASSITSVQSVIPAKQQLVAHVAQSGNQVSHSCEPCYFQE